MLRVDHAQGKIKQGLETRRQALEEQYHQVLNDTGWNRALNGTPRGLIAVSEVDALIKYVPLGLAAIPAARGRELADLGLGEEIILRLGQVTRQFALAYLDRNLHAQAIDLLDSYHTALMQSFVQRRQEFMLEEQDRSRAELERSMGQYSAHLQLAAEMARLMGGAAALDAMMQSAVDLIRRSLDIFFVGVFTVDQARQFATLRAGTGSAGAELVQRGYSLSLAETSPVATAINSGEPQLNAGIPGQVPPFLHPLLSDTRTELALPVFFTGATVGALSLQSQSENAFDSRDVTALQIVAGQVAGAAALPCPATAPRPASYTPAPASDRKIGPQVSEAGPRTFFYQVDEDRFRPAGEWPLAPPQPVIAPALEPTTELTVPVVLRDQMLGQIELYDMSRPRVWTDEDVALANTVAAQVALALENASLFTAAQQELAERKRAEAEVETSLKEKEIMLKEIHHRVKNNLQVVSSLLNLEAGRIKDKEMIQILKESQSRIRSMALIHEKLYRSKDLAHVDFDGYVRDLAAYLFRTYKSNVGPVDLIIDIHDAMLSIDRAIPCGLIINELISNALKYAFPEGRGGYIRVGLQRPSAAELLLQVSDNGVGFPEGVDFRNTESLGMQLVSTLTTQLGGTLDLDPAAGTSFKVTFPFESPVV
ncbi:MAG: sensor histidine kinase [Rudaea sp.]